MTRSNQYWKAVVNRDASADGTFYYGVLITGVYCRPSCPSRGARRENVRFLRIAGGSRKRRIARMSMLPAARAHGR